MEEKAKFSPKEYYRERIIQMIKEINNAEYLEKIYHYVTVPYKMDKEKRV